MTRIAFAIVTLLWYGAWAAAQAQEPLAFAVVSIKENKSGAPDGQLRINPGGQLHWTNTTLQSLIGTAAQRFAFDNREITGGPVLD